jgi:methylated-DNA-[protein]-cysteine S-methyltransferase
MTTLLSKTIESPVGELTLVGSDAGLRAVLWPSEREGRVVFVEDVEEGDHPLLDAAALQLLEYISGERQDFDVPLDLVGTDFQKDVWAGLARIPYGHTQSYGELADELNKPGAARAIGAATGRNPISIIVPCHRLVGSSGKLTGFAGGLDTKRWLLDHESPTEQLSLDA